MPVQGPPTAAQRVQRMVFLFFIFRFTLYFFIFFYRFLVKENDDEVRSARAAAHMPPKREKLLWAANDQGQNWFLGFWRRSGSCV